MKKLFFSLLISLLFVGNAFANIGGNGGVGGLNTWILDGSDNLTPANSGWGVILPVGGTAGGDFTPTTSDGAGLGTGSLMWSDLFLASGAVVNFNNGDITATHSANLLSFEGASTGYYFDTNIGIGTTSPNSFLEVSDGAFTAGMSTVLTASASADGRVIPLTIANSLASSASSTNEESCIQISWKDVGTSVANANLICAAKGGDYTGAASADSDQVFYVTLNNALVEAFRLVSSKLALFAGPSAWTPSSVQTLAAGTTLTVTNGHMYVDGSGGAVTLTSTPNIANGTEGECVTIWGDDGTNTVTFQDADNLANSGLALAGDVNAVLGLGDNIELCYTTLNSVALWREKSRALTIDD